jgi:hypothetical protein
MKHFFRGGKGRPRRVHEIVRRCLKTGTGVVYKLREGESKPWWLNTTENPFPTGTRGYANFLPEWSSRAIAAD